MRLIRALSIVVLFVPALWWTLALHFAGPRPGWLATSLGIAYAIGTLVILVWLRPFWRALAVYAAAFAALALWWGSIAPSNSRDWAPDVAQIPSGELHGDLLTLHNVRNFDYRSETDFTARYEDRSYDLSKLRGVDLFMSYWGSPAIAHTIMSWQFEGGLPLSISIETRKDKTQQYSAIQGFFKQYMLCYVAADERDLVRLRTNHRGEQVYLYRLKVPIEQARALLLDYLASMNGLVEHPRFYDALTHNCTTSIRRHAVHVNPNAPPFDWRLLVNGYGDQMLYEQGRIDTSMPFPELRARSLVNERAKAADQDPDFSQRIREGLPDPRAAGR